MQSNGARSGFITRAGITCLLVFALLASATIALWSMDGTSETFTGSYYDQRSKHYIDRDQYAHLAHALLEGHLYLDLPVADGLDSLENVTDPEARAEIGSQANPIYWDYAFYDGHYYSYFGVMPAVVLYLPFEALTGTPLNTSYAVLLLGIAACAAIVFLVRSFLQKYFRVCGSHLLLISLALYLGSNVTYCVTLQWFYSVPILFSLVVTFVGLGLWMSAAPVAEKPSMVRVCLGALLIAMNFGSRPQFILSALAAFFIFHEQLFTLRLFFSKKGLRNTLLILGSFAIVLLPFMLYNYARFDSPLNFGSHYNLTGFDMTQYQQSFSLTLYLLGQYLIQIPDLSTAFPFIISIPFSFDYGWSPHEPMYGGWLWFAPFSLFALGLVSLRKGKYKNTSLLLLSIFWLGLAAFILVFDTRNAGLSQRYLCDAWWMVTLAASAGFLSLYYSWRNKQAAAGGKTRHGKVALNAALAACLAVSLVLTTCSLLAPDRYTSVANLNPSLYTSLQSLFLGLDNGGAHEQTVPALD